MSWNEDLVKRQIFRHGKEEPEVPKKNKKKNTKDFCRGKEGEFHIPIKVPYIPWGLADRGWVLTKCDKCGKHLDIWYPPPRWMTRRH